MPTHLFTKIITIFATLCMTTRKIFSHKPNEETFYTDYRDGGRCRRKF